MFVVPENPNDTTDFKNAIVLRPQLPWNHVFMYFLAADGDGLHLRIRSRLRKCFIYRAIIYELYIFSALITRRFWIHLPAQTQQRSSTTIGCTEAANLHCSQRSWTYKYLQFNWKVERLLSHRLMHRLQYHHLSRTQEQEVAGLKAITSNSNNPKSDDVLQK